jgi:hypothetical protein
MHVCNSQPRQLQLGRSAPEYAQLLDRKASPLKIVRNVSVDVEADDAPERIGVQLAGQSRLPRMESSADEL